MDELMTEPVRTERPLARHTQLEVDTFCPQCGYNLHGQPVSRDERLGVLIVRCPECGGYHPAGLQTTAHSAWTGRLATALLVFWVLVIVAAVIAAIAAMGGIVMLPLEIYTETVMVDTSGRTIEYRQIGTSGGYGAVYLDTGKPAANPVHRAQFRKLNPQQAANVWEALLILHVMSIGLGFTCGFLMVVFLWHWNRRRYFWALVLPFLVTGFVLAFMLNDDFYVWVRAWAAQHALYYAAVQAAALAAGILVGRPLVRLFLRMFIPPRARQHFNFLWRVDGKIPPPATSPG